jgi:hypothetical protein
MPYAVTARNLALDAITVDRVRLHSADPGASGTDNALGSLTAATFNAASSGERLLNADVTLTSLGANQAVSHFSLWLNSGTVFRGGFAITSGDTNANSAGEYTLKATTTKMTSPTS